MLEYQLLLLFGVCAAVITVSGFIIIKCCRGAEKSSCPIIAIPLTSETANLEFIVRNFVYPTAERFPDVWVAAIDFDAGNETLRIFDKLMERSCRYKIINSEECSEFICKL